MIRINLLPVRELRKKEELQRHFLIIGAMVVVVAGIIIYMNVSIKSHIKKVQSQLKQTEAEIARLQRIIGEVDKIKEIKKNLEDKLNAIKDLDRGRNYAVHIMDELSKAIPVDYSRKIPKSIQLTSFDVKGKSAIIKGLSLDNKSISDFINNLEASAYFSNPDLKGSRVKGGKTKIKMYQFEVSVNLTQPDGRGK